MKISIIVAMASNNVIGLNNQIPWHLSDDLKRFKEITMGRPILMGRKTYESIGMPLPGRTNIISRNLLYHQEGCLVFDSIKKVMVYCQNNTEIFIIGGNALYRSALPTADNLYLTQINKDFKGDTFFPEINKSKWNLVEREDVKNDQSVDFSYSFLKFSRKI